MTLPNFFIIGAAKSGTSSLYMYLNQHPDIFMSPVKEPHFFSFNFKTKWPQGPGDNIHLAVTDFIEYQKLFADVKSEKAIGEASTSYLYIPDTANRIYEMLPNAKIITILRNPAERAFSAYMHLIRDQREYSSSFEEALRKETERKENNWDPIWHYTNVGFYYHQLIHFFDLFPEDHIKVFLYEELINNTKVVIKNIFSFLEVNPEFTPNFSVRFNVSGKQRSVLLHKLIKLIFNTPNPIRWISRQCIPDTWRWKITNWIREQNLLKKQLTTQQRNHLNNIYQEDILNLQSLISRDLSHWLE